MVLVETSPNLSVTVTLILWGPGLSRFAACQASEPLKFAGKPLLTKCARLLRVSWIVISRTPFVGLLAATAMRNGPRECWPQIVRTILIDGGA